MIAPGCGEPERVVLRPSYDASTDASCDASRCSPYRCGSTGRCATSCAVTGDCASGFVCDRGFCVGTDCTAETAAARCGGYSCVGGTCSRDCTSATCLAGFYCQGDTKRCVRKCTTRDDPSCGGYVCDLTVGECEPYCLAGELECAGGFVCTPSMTCTASDAGPG